MTPFAFIDLIGDGFQALWEYKIIIGLLIIEIFGLGGLGLLLWRKRNDHPYEGDFFAWVVSAGIGAFVVSSYAIVALGRIWTQALPILSSLLLIISLVGFVGFFLSSAKNDQFPTPRSLSISSLLIILLIVTIRLAFLKQLEFPLYYDSAEHYQTIASLQDPTFPQRGSCGVETLDPSCYYHLGFHSLVVVMSQQVGDRFSIAQLILGIGHACLLLFIASLYLLVERLSDHRLHSGMITVIFAGFGWTMPAFAVNWGKYPAIASLAVSPLVVYWIAASLAPKVKFDGKRIISLCIICLGMALLHSRSIIYLFCALCAFALIYYFRNKITQEDSLFFLYDEILIIWIISILNPNFHEAILPYFQGADLILTLLAVFLGIYALQTRHKHLVLAIFAFVIFMAIFSSLPTPNFLGNHTGGYFLDRPFVQLSLFVPLAILAGLGGADIINDLLLRIQAEGRRQWIAQLTLIALAIITVCIRPPASYRPDLCCIYMRVDDQFVIGWLANHAPKQALVLIAADTSSPNVRTPTDAGVWITPLTGIKTEKLDLEYEFSAPENFEQLCRADIEYIFASAVNASFSIAEIEKRKEFYIPTIILPDTRLYQVHCKPS